MDDLVLLSKMYDKGCIDRVRAVASQPFGRCSYTGEGGGGGEEEKEGFTLICDRGDRDLEESCSKWTQI